MKKIQYTIPPTANAPRKEKTMKITQKMIREVKRMDRQTFHDEAWWAFQLKPETTAIQVAMHAAKDGDSAADIVASAQKYMESQMSAH